MRLFTIVTLICLPVIGFTQEFKQYFDGADTIYNSNFWDSSIRVHINDSISSSWRISQPMKSVFNRASTVPNAIITDTINYYSTNDSSSFQYSIKPWTNRGILAFQWKQKLDTDYGNDGGIIEFSIDEGNTWQNVFNNPYVYNFYGFSNENVDTLQNGQMAFTGTDSLWRDIWLCYDMSWLNESDSIMVRHTFVSDNNFDEKDGWMIDNLLVHVTIFHIVNELKEKQYMAVTPTPTTGNLNIKTKKLDQYHIIEKIELRNMEGKLVQKWGVSPTKFRIDINDHPNGVYFLTVKTNVKTETFKIVLEK